MYKRIVYSALVSVVYENFLYVFYYIKRPKSVEKWEN